MSLKHSCRCCGQVSGHRPVSAMAALCVIVHGRAVSRASASCAHGTQVAVPDDVPRQAGLGATDGAGAGSRKRRDAARFSAAAVGAPHRCRFLWVTLGGTAFAPCSEAQSSSRPLHRAAQCAFTPESSPLVSWVQKCVHYVCFDDLSPSCTGLWHRRRGVTRRASGCRTSCTQPTVRRSWVGCPLQS